MQRARFLNLAARRMHCLLLKFVMVTKPAPPTSSAAAAAQMAVALHKQRRCMDVEVSCKIVPLTLIILTCPAAYSKKTTRHLSQLPPSRPQRSACWNAVYNSNKTLMPSLKGSAYNKVVPSHHYNIIMSIKSSHPTIIMSIKSSHPTIIILLCQ